MSKNNKKIEIEEEDVKTEALNEETNENEAQDAEKAEEAQEDGAEAAKETNEEKDEAEEWKDKYIRLYAEFENYKKRTLKEKAELILNGGEKSITAILPILRRAWNT